MFYFYFSIFRNLEIMKNLLNHFRNSHRNFTKTINLELIILLTSFYLGVSLSKYRVNFFLRMFRILNFDKELYERYYHIFPYYNLFIFLISIRSSLNASGLKVFFHPIQY